MREVESVRVSGGGVGGGRAGTASFRNCCARESLILQANSLLLLTTPADDLNLLLAPFRPMKIRVMACPIESCFSVEQVRLGQLSCMDPMR